MFPELAFFLLLVIGNCTGTGADAQACKAPNMNVRVPYESYEQCEAASRNVLVPEGMQGAVRGVCIAVPASMAKKPQAPALAGVPAAAPSPVAPPASAPAAQQSPGTPRS